MAACSPSCAPTAESTTSNDCTGSNIAWEAAASLQLRSGDPRALDAYEAHDRIIPGTLEDHLAAMADSWIEHHSDGDTVALVASTNDHVDAINHAVQAARVAAGQLNPDTAAAIAGGEHAHVGDVVATRRNDRTLVTSAGETVRNRETWTVTAIGTDGSLTVTRERGHGTVTLPADYVHDHVRLGYAATEHGYQSDTVDHSVSLVSPVTTRRGLYVAATRGRDQNLLCVVTDSTDVAEARDTLEVILAYDRADIPAVTQRRTLAHQQPAEAWRQPSAPAGRCDVPRVVRIAPRRPAPRHVRRRAGPHGRARRGGPDLQPRPPPRNAASSGSRRRRPRLARRWRRRRASTKRRGGTTLAPNTTSTTAASAADATPAATTTPLSGNSKL